MGCVQHIIIIELLLNLQRFFSMTKPREFHNPYSWKLGSYLLTAWEIGIFLNDYISKGWCPGP